MEKNISAVILICSTLLLALGGCITCPHRGITEANIGANDDMASMSSEEPHSVNSEGLEETDRALFHAEAQIISVDYKTRQFSIRDKYGEVIRLRASNFIRNFGQIRAGERVIVNYYRFVKFEPREPTANELQSSQVNISASERAQFEWKPTSTAVAQKVQIVSVAAFSKDRSLLVVQGRGGDVATIRVKYPENLSYIKVGDTVVLKYPEGFAAACARAY